MRFDWLLLKRSSVNLDFIGFFIGYFCRRVSVLFVFVCTPCFYKCYFYRKTMKVKKIFKFFKCKQMMRRQLIPYTLLYVFIYAPNQKRKRKSIINKKKYYYYCIELLRMRIGITFYLFTFFWVGIVFGFYEIWLARLDLALNFDSLHWL